MNPSDDSTPAYLSTCPSCDGVIDVTYFEPFSQVVCPHCADSIRVRQKFDHFTIQKELGEGGMSRVFDALDSTLGRHVALKILNRSYSKDSVRMASFEREAQLTASVTHPNVVKLYSVGRDQANFYIAMELVSGGSLEERINKHGKLPELEVLRVGRSIAEGLRAAAREGLIHRDIKPANILFTENGTPKLADFGLAIFHGRDRDESGEVWATPHYVPPEKLHDEAEEDFRSDMYSLGATLFHALTGKPPYESNTNSIQELKVIKSQKVCLEDSKMTFSARTGELINQLIALEPKDRFQSYDLLIDAFRYAEGLLGYSEIGQKTRKMRKVTFLVAALVLGGLLAILLRPTKQGAVEEVSDETEIVQEGAGVTLPPDVESISEKFLKARQALVSGKYDAAYKAFKNLVENKRVKQPTLNWSRFNAALAALILRDEKEARKYFGEIQSQADEGPELLSSAHKGFFAKLGARMSQDLGLKFPAPTGTYQRDNEELMGYLAQGVAHWQFGTAENASLWLEIFLNSNVPERMEWIKLYHPIAEMILKEDTKIQLSGLLKSDVKAGTSKEAVVLDNQVSNLLKGLTFRGTYYRRLEKLSKDLKARIAVLKKSEQGAEEERKKGLLTRETLQFQQFMKTLSSVARGYDYQPVLELLHSLQFESPEVVQRKTAKIYMYTLSREFMEHLMEDVNKLSYSGKLTNKDGAIIQGQVVLMTYPQTTVALPQGKVTVATENLSPESLLQMAQVYLDQERNSTTYYRRLESMMAFARMHQMKERSETLLAQLIQENSEFKKRWSNIEAFDE